MNRRVLFVDDDSKLLDSISRNLRGYYEIHTATSGTEALDLLHRGNSYAVIASDYMMPEMDGISFFEKAQKIASESTFLLFTGHTETRVTLANALRCNVKEFLGKPFRVKDLQNTLERLVVDYNLSICSSTIGALLAELDGQTRSGAAVTNMLLPWMHKFELDNEVNTVYALHQLLTRLLPSVAGHSRRVGNLAWYLGEHLGLSAPERQELYLSALLHDIGKLTLPEAIVLAGPVTDSHVNTMLERHCYAGYELLNKFSSLSQIPLVCLQHHERWDGQGYPRGLKGEKVTRAAQIVSLCNRLEKLLSRQVQMPCPGAIDQELEPLRDTAHPSCLVDAFLQAWDTWRFYPGDSLPTEQHSVLSELQLAPRPWENHLPD